LLAQAARVLGPALSPESIDDPPTDQENVDALKSTVQSLRKAAGEGNGPGAVTSRRLADALQKLIAAACRVYSARTEAGEQFTPVPRNSISATDVMLTASGLLRAADLAVFELGMWQSWTGR